MYISVSSRHNLKGVACFTKHSLQNHAEALKVRKSKNFASKCILLQLCSQNRAPVWLSLVFKMRNSKPKSFNNVPQFASYVLQRQAATCFFFPGTLRDCGAYAKLEKLMQGKEKEYAIYGDPVYPLPPLLMKPYGGAHVTAPQQTFNMKMSQVRQAVEWGFGKVVAEFAFLDFFFNQKLLRQQVSQMYKVGTLLSNCHTCLYGSQVSQYFNLDPPCLRHYLQATEP